MTWECVRYSHEMHVATLRLPSRHGNMSMSAYQTLHICVWSSQYSCPFLCTTDRPASGDISKSVVESAIAQIMGKGQGFELVTIINAFDIPKISYDAVGRKMFADTVPRSLFADATVSKDLKHSHTSKHRQHEA